MQYQKNFLGRRHKEVCTWFRNFIIDNLEDWFYYCGYTSLWLMLVQFLYPQERFLIFSQHAQECIFEVWVKWRKHCVALLVIVSNLKEDQSAVALSVYQALEAVPTMHFQERNEINNHRKENSDWHSRKFFLLFTTISSSRIWNEPSAFQTSLLKKVIYLADHHLERITQTNTQNQYSASPSFGTGRFLAQNLSTFAGWLILLSLLQIFHILRCTIDRNS